jgi:choline dehydrogenase-like flavoprotein
VRSGAAVASGIVDHPPARAVELEYRARLVFLCAGALESARLLLLSTSGDFPDGLANGSGQVGRNVMDHIKGAGATARFEGWEQFEPRGVRPNGVYVFPFRNVRERHPDFPRAYAIQGGAAAFVVSIDGPRDNVIGLPMELTRRLLARAGLSA